MDEESRDNREIQQRLDAFDTRIQDLQHELGELRALLAVRDEITEEQEQITPELEYPQPITTLPPEPTVTTPPAMEVETPAIPFHKLPEPPQKQMPPPRTTVDIEALLSGRVMAWVGGLAILVGSLFFLSLAFSRGWIGPETRVIIGLIAGAAMVTGGAFFFERRERLFGHTLLAVGLGVFNLALFASTRLYDLIPFELALLGTFVAAAFGSFIAIRAHSQVVAAYGLLPALIAPPLFYADTTGVTIAFLALLLIGTAAISIYRTWTWLPFLTLLFTFFQLYAWLDESPQAVLGLAVMTGYWLIHALAAGGEDIRKLRGRLRPSSALLMVLNTAVALGGAHILLDGTLAEWRGLYLFVLAALHMPLAGYLFYRAGNRHAFGMLTMGLGLALGAIAVPVQFGGETVPIAWAAAGVVMVWLYGRLRNPFSLASGVLLGLAAVWHVVLFEYPIRDFLSGETLGNYPFINGSGAVLGAMLIALAASAYLARSKDVLTGALLAGSVLLAYALPYELEDGWIIAGWALIALALFAIHRAEPSGHPLYAAVGLGLDGFALLVTLAQIATPSRLRISSFSTLDHAPFWSDATLALASLAISLTAGWYLHRRDFPQYAGLALALATSLVVYLLSIGLVDDFQQRLDADGGNLSSLREQAQVGLSILWTVFGVAGFVLGVVLRRIGMRIYGLALLGIAIVKVFIVDLASLDASYRVISFIALGILLLLASYLYQRLIAHPNGNGHTQSVA